MNLFVKKAAIAWTAWLMSQLVISILIGVLFLWLVADATADRSLVVHLLVFFSVVTIYFSAAAFFLGIFGANLLWSTLAVMVPPTLLLMLSARQEFSIYEPVWTFVAIVVSTLVLSLSVNFTFHRTRRIMTNHFISA